MRRKEDLVDFQSEKFQIPTFRFQVGGQKPETWNLKPETACETNL
jgi:hypothetical protein